MKSSFIADFKDRVEVYNETIMDVFISQPMSGLSEKEILAYRQLAIKNLTKIQDKYNKEYPDDRIRFEFIDNTQFNEKKTPLGYMAKDVELLDTADIVYFADGWENSKGCNIEYTLCKTYDIPMIFGCTMGIITKSLNALVKPNK